MNNVMRKTLAGGWTPFEFQGLSKRFFVKNYSDNDIYVSFIDGDNENASFKVASGLGEEVATTFRNYERAEDYKTTIYVKGTGEVEVQALDI